MKNIVVGITGASGAIYGRRLCQVLVAGGARVHLVISPHGRMLLQSELELTEVTAETLVGPAVAASLIIHDHADLHDPLASGSTLTDGMAICPCSSNTLAAVAAGLADNLLTRAAHVHLKQRRKLVLVTRESPVSSIELENQLRLAHAGAVIAPASPGFYCRPETIDDLADFMVARICECLGLSHGLPMNYGNLG